MRGINLLTAHRKSWSYEIKGIADYRKIYLFRNKAWYVNKAVNPGFCEKMEVTRVPPGRSSRTTSGTHATGWESLA